MNKDKKHLENPINKDVLIILIKNPNTKQIEITYSKIHQYFTQDILQIENLCNDPKMRLDHLHQFFKNFHKLNEIQGQYNYCDEINSAWENKFYANPKDTASEIIAQISKIEEMITERKKLIELNENSEDNEKQNSVEKKAEILKYEQQLINNYKTQLKNQYILWGEAYSMKQAYKTLLSDNNEIIAYSHRIGGWSNPVYDLTENFSLEIKTNFGYGKSSYFYLLSTFKNIPISPFSDWIYYRYADVFEIIQYSQSYPLSDEYWINAMEYSKEACNLSLTDEINFVQTYLIDECEKMVSGLEKIFVSKIMTFKQFGTNKLYEVEFNETHLIVLFRAEKISGALEFISKIKDYNELISISSFIKRIEKLNKDIKPTLEEEIKESSIKLSKLKEQIKESESELEKIKQKRAILDKKWDERKEKMKSDGTFDSKIIPLIEERKKVNKAFHKKYPEYQNFKSEFYELTVKKRNLENETSDLNDYIIQITLYNDKIEAHFSNK
jgi:hypothetical protein